MGTKRHLGDFEFMVMAAVLRLGDDAYGARIRREIEDRTGRDVSMGAVHATLDRMERKGYLSSWFGDPTPERGGKARRFFRPEGAGREVFSEAAGAVRSMLSGLVEQGGLP